MADRVVAISSDKQYQEELKIFSDNQLVVIDFFATWCGPCHMIAPKFAELSLKYLSVKFLKVDVDKCQFTAVKYDIKAMPTFIFIKQNKEVDRIRGGDPTKLESAVIQWIGTSFQLEPDPQRIAVGRSFPAFSDLLKNERKEFDIASDLLVRFASNVLRDPQNLKYRQIKLTNEIFMNKILPVLGAIDCLFTMGFEEMADRLLLPPASSLDNLHALRDALVDERNIIGTANIKPVVGSSLNSNVTSPSCTSGQALISGRRKLKYQAQIKSNEEATFFSSIQSCVNKAFLYEEDELQNLARSKIPVSKLKEKADKNSQATSDQTGKCLVSMNDCLLLLLLQWFKNDFFTWMNTPECSGCHGATKHSRLAIPDAEESKWGAGNVELYECTQCSSMMRFPRYNHPQKLLETRTGRCGEWANCFSLCCRAVGFETRFVLDWTDHVWTEVYSEDRKRWLHCDPCENLCDKPLVYEHGWKKELSYVIAFSAEQVVDVTWRYSSKHQEVIRRRNLVSESWLFGLCKNINKELQYGLSDESRKILTSRDIVEMVEFITPKEEFSNEEGQGRLSGSMAWRQLRGETKEGNVVLNTEKSHKFQLNAENIERKSFRIRFLPVKDCYYTTLDDPLGEPVIQGWENGVETCENVFMKREKDWKMVYLARMENTDHGSISWCIDLSDTELVVQNVDVKVTSKVYNSGKAMFSICSGDECIRVNKNGGSARLETAALAGSRKLHLNVNLCGGEGSVAWQHAQIFRCSETDEDFLGLDMKVTLQSKEA